VVALPHTILHSPAPLRLHHNLGGGGGDGGGGGLSYILNFQSRFFTPFIIPTVLHPFCSSQLLVPSTHLWSVKFIES
jgi:hypothetical protein